MGHDIPASSSSPSPEYEILKDPVYGYIRLYDHEKVLVNSRAFQRLRRLKQTPSVHYVYPGATHTRFSHSLGVMHTSGMFVDKLLEPLIYNNEIEIAEARRFFFLVRLWGLAHDIGHGPFSHVFDDTVLLDLGYNHESMSAKILCEDEEIREIFEKKITKNLGITTLEIAELMTKSREEWEPKNRLGKSDHYDSAFYHILLGNYSSDIIDYLLRDSLYTGAGYGSFDWQRLLMYSRLHKDEMALEKKAEDCLYAFLLARLFMFDTVYYHTTSRAFDRVTEEFLKKTKEVVRYEDCLRDIRLYLALDEESILHDPRLTSIEECSYLLERRNPYSSVDESRIPLPRDRAGRWTRLALDRNFLQSSVAQRLPDIPKDAFFVDTPSLPLNPMTQNDEICFIDTSTTPPTETRRPIHDAFWMEIPHRVYIIRLYVQKSHLVSAEKIKSAFRELAERKETRPSFF